MARTPSASVFSERQHAVGVRTVLAGRVEAMAQQVLEVLDRQACCRGRGRAISTKRRVWVNGESSAIVVSGSGVDRLERVRGRRAA